MTTQWSKYEATAARKHGKPGREIRPQNTTFEMLCARRVPTLRKKVTTPRA